MNEYTHPVPELVAKLSASGILLGSRTGNCASKAPAGALSTERRQMLQARKGEILAHLIATDTSIR